MRKFTLHFSACKGTTYLINPIYRLLKNVKIQYTWISFTFLHFTIGQNYCLLGSIIKILTLFNTYACIIYSRYISVYQLFKLYSNVLVGKSLKLKKMYIFEPIGHDHEAVSFKEVNFFLSRSCIECFPIFSFRRNKLHHSSIEFFIWPSRLIFG